uniref:MULE transposase domain-containing protein n=1 Tax=Ditylenchus dipsaci TaxID=166011 RepID=A0A915E718_9BILA
MLILSSDYMLRILGESKIIACDGLLKAGLMLMLARTTQYMRLSMSPCARCRNLYEKQEETTYVRLLNILRGIILTKYNLAMQPEVALTDFERAIRAALRTVWPAIEHRCCHFHFNQAGVKRFCGQSKEAKRGYMKNAGLNDLLHLKDFDHPDVGKRRGLVGQTSKTCAKAIRVRDPLLQNKRSKTSNPQSFWLW